MSEIAVLKITLKHTEPSIWRRIEFPMNATFAKLHGTIQAVFGWDNAHLHEFRIGGEEIGLKAGDAPPEVRDGRRRKVATALQRGVRAFTYNYDFGDDWQCEIVVEKIQESNAKRVMPRCLAGKYNGPPEDCGGPYQYSEDAMKLRRPGRRRGEKLQWYDPEFDPDHFDVDEANAEIRARLDMLSTW